jgi:hypothetical protein
MVHNNRGKATQRAATMHRIPIHHAEHSIKSNNRGGLPLVGPRVPPPVEIDLLQLTIVQESPEASHHAAMEVIVVIILVPVDHVKVPT